jgi:hypothetical protein
MPKKSKNRSRTVSTPFHAILVLTATGNLLSVSGAPSTGALCARLLTLSDPFDEYRYIRLRYRILPYTQATPGFQTIALYPGVTTTPPTSLATSGENPYVAYWGGQAVQDRPSEWVNVPRGILLGEQPWYKVAQTVSLADSVPFFLYGSVFTSGDTATIEVDGVIQFRGEADIANTPEALAKATLKMQAKMLDILRFSDKETSVVALTRLPFK